MLVKIEMAYSSYDFENENVKIILGWFFGVYLVINNGKIIKASGLNNNLKERLSTKCGMEL